MLQLSPYNPRSKANRLALAALALATCSSCATVQSKGPHIQVCFIEQARGGIECAMEDNRTVFLRWAEVQGSFLAGFDKQVLITRQGFERLLAWGKRK